MSSAKRRLLGVATIVVATAAAASVGGFVFAQTGGSSPSGSIAQPPRLLSYAGFLESNGNTVDVSTPMRFFITDAPGAPATACGGANGCLWQSDMMNVAVNDGHFAVVLGEAPAFPSQLFTRTTLYLRMQVGSSLETLGGAQRLVATPYALTAETPSTFRVESLAASSTIVSGGKVTAQAGLDVTGGTTAVQALTAASISTPSMSGTTMNGDLNMPIGAHLRRISYTEFVLGTGDTTWGTDRLISLAPATSACFLSGSRHFDNSGSSGTDQCYTEISGGAWYLRLRQHDASQYSECRAVCLNW